MLMLMRTTIAAVAIGLFVAACGSGTSGGSGPTVGNHGGAGDELASPSVITQDILDREPVANRTKVQHILISWADHADSFDGRIDPRAAARSQADAEREVRSVLAALQGGAAFETEMSARSEDPGSAQSGNSYTVTPDAGLVLEFRQLGLRLQVGEIGVVESDFGFHVMKRVE